MPRIQRPFVVCKRKDTKKFILTLNSVSGLPARVCSEWHRVSFSNLPQELCPYREPASKAAAETGAMALIQYLKAGEGSRVESDSATVGDWVKLFISIETSPRAARLVGKNRPYSPASVDGYASYYRAHIEGDPFLKLKMAEVEQADILQFLNRLAAHKINEQKRTSKRAGRIKEYASVPEKPPRILSGTRTFEAIYKFIRMTFKEYQKHHPRWVDPFLSIDPPRPLKKGRRDALEADEVLRLFAPGVLLNPMERAVCAAMFWAGLRRSEIWALKPEDLDWKTPKITIRHAWKNYNKKGRVLEDPKHHHERDVAFPDALRQAIRELWEYNGQHEFVFCRKDGTLPGVDYIIRHFPRWLKRAGIDPSGRKIVPHSSRHSLASLLEAEGVQLRYIQDMLGHSDLETTLGYLHSPQGTINRIARKIGEIAEQSENHSNVRNIG
ncbi:hypothetical protein FACS189450_03290 [Spirochaetia bacterium]|nr:hypothetical protein FACS189450_03290 [Spirochaetia bacterium]